MILGDEGSSCSVCRMFKRERALLAMLNISAWCFNMARGAKFPPCHVECITVKLIAVERICMVARRRQVLPAMSNA